MPYLNNYRCAKHKIESMGTQVIATLLYQSNS